MNSASCAERAQFGDEGRAGVIAATGDDDIGAFFGEGERGGAADAGQRTSDQDDGMAHTTSPRI